MGWSEGHVHSWMIHTGIKMMVETEVTDPDDGEELIADIPFCPWVCGCGVWRWKISPEVMLSTDDHMEI